jgi:hypothetical protein
MTPCVMYASNAKQRERKYSNNDEGNNARNDIRIWARQANKANDKDVEIKIERKWKQMAFELKSLKIWSWPSISRYRKVMASVTVGTFRSAALGPTTNIGVRIASCRPKLN